MQSVIVVGGGVVGLTLALALGRQSIPVTVVHCDAMPDAAVLAAPWGVRVSAIHEKALSAFASLGIATFAKQGVIDRLHVRDVQRSDVLLFQAAELGAPYLGLILENAALQRQLYDAVLACSAVRCIEAQPVTLACTDQESVVTLSTGEVLHGSVVAGADGAHSWVRKEAHFVWQDRPYGHWATVACVKTERPHRETAYQIFRPEGPVALLPLTDSHHMSLVWSRALAEPIGSNTEFNTALQAAFGDILGNLAVQTQPVAIPLHERHAERYVQPGVVLLGDAAHTIHPLAGQGMNLGIMDALALAGYWGEAFQRRIPLGRLSVLQRFERTRRFSTTVMMKSMATFHHAFAAESGWLSWVRGGALDMVTHCKPVRQALTAAGMGRWESFTALK